MSQLSNIIQKCVAAVEVPGRTIKIHRAVELAVPMILADPDTTKHAVREFATVKVRQSISAGVRKALDAPSGFVRAWKAGTDGREDIEVIIPRQGDLFIDPFDLEDGYSLEGGTGKVQRTRNATMPEFEGFIRIRVKQAKDDLRHLNRMRVTLERLRPIWEVDRMMSYQEACAFYVRQYGMPTLPDDEDDD
jgi:hypothetical protein